MALGSTQTLTETSSLPGIFRGGKGDRCVGLTILPPLCAARLEIWKPQPPVKPTGLSRPVQGLLFVTSNSTLRRLREQVVLKRG